VIRKLADIEHERERVARLIKDNNDGILNGLVEAFGKWIIT